MTAPIAPTRARRIMSTQCMGCCRVRRRRGRRRRTSALLRFQSRRLRCLCLMCCLFAIGFGASMFRRSRFSARRVSKWGGGMFIGEEASDVGDVPSFLIDVDVVNNRAVPRAGRGGVISAREHRELSSSASCDDHRLAQGGVGQAILLIIGILFTFNGLAIVCDEFFQASLEKISDVLELTPDVAGATFLAAGSSAPELFTSFADVFGPSNSIGVGAIVGSAMFNMLVIVAMSAAVATRSGNVLRIDHRVVARDVSFYTASIVILVIACNDGEINWWEGLIMVLAYGLYIVFMKYNRRILAMCSTPRVTPTGGDGLAADLEEKRESVDSNREPERLASANISLEIEINSGHVRTSHRALGFEYEEAFFKEGVVPSRGGEQLRGDGAGEGAASRRGSYRNDRRATRALRISLRQERDALPGTTSDEAGNSQRVAAAAAAAAAAEFDGDACKRESGTANKRSAARLSWDASVDEDKVAREELARNGCGVMAMNPSAGARDSRGSGLVTRNPIMGGSLGAEDLMDDRLAWPKGWGERLLFLFGLPFMVGLSLTVPDCSKPAYERYYVATFVMSIVWISLITSYMVELATGAACILGVSAVVMGVLVLAVGTSVPDMIGSMIAAKNGEASMAIANAIGSNVFDILLGLGLPWLLRPMFKGGTTKVDKDGVLATLIILFFTVTVFVGSLVLTRWYMNQTLGYCLLAMYGVYVIFTVVAETIK